MRTRLLPPTSIWATFLSAGLVSAHAALVDMSAPLQDVSATYTGFEMVCRVFDPAQNQFMENRTAVGNVFGLVNVNGVVAWSSGNALFVRTYDPGRTNWAVLNVAAGVAQDVRNHRGLVAWTSANHVNYHVYEPISGTFLSDSGPGNTFDLQSTDGIISWTSGNTVYLRTFDPASRQWQGLNVPGGQTFNLSNTNGVAAWSSGGAVRSRVYDAFRRQWAGDDTAAASLLELRNDSGMVAWSNGSACWMRLFNPVTGQWVGGGFLSPSGMVLGLAITNATLSWSDGFRTHLAGFDWYQTNWYEGRTLALPFFAASTNAGAAPLPVRFTDMSMGTLGQSWNFGDGTAASSGRSPAHTYTNLGRFTPTLTVIGLGTNLVARTNLLTDLQAPSGQIVINDGATSTTNRNVTLTIAAADNSGSVPRMRLSNDGTTWADWEAFVTNKAWVLPEGVATRTVFAQFEDPFGNQSAVVSDSIFLDTTPPPLANFEMASTNYIEQNRTLSFKVVLDHPMSSRSVRVDYATRDGSAQAGSDFAAAAGTLVYPAGVTEQVVSVQLRDDALVELNEVFQIELLNPVDVVPGDPLSITILDNDAPTARFATDRFSAGEADGTAGVMVLLSPASGLRVTMEYAVTNGTALADLDFVPVTGVLTFEPGQTSQVVSVPILDDLEDEFTESARVSLSHATNAVLGAPATATIEILDNDPPTANFQAPEYWASEANGSVTLSVNLTKPYAQNIFVDYRTEGGTAGAGLDYVVASGTLIFTPGQTNRTFPVTILQDTVADSQETIGVRLAGFVNVYPGSRVEAQIRTLDPDQVALTPAGFRPDGSFQLRMVGPSGRRLRLDTSPDLAAWTELATVENPAGTTEYHDPGAVGKVLRYYRAQLVP